MPLRKKKTAKRKKATKRTATKARSTKRAPIRTKPPVGESAEIHQDIHPVEPTPEMKPR